MTCLTHSDRIIERVYVRGIFELTSPCIIGSGENDRADVDVVRDGKGRPYIPGTSLAGALRNFLESRQGTDDEKVQLMFGRRKDKYHDTTQSRLYVSDACMDEGQDCSRMTTVRDGVRLDLDTKTAQKHKKFDYEVVEPGAKFVLKLELVLREKDQNRVKQLEKMLFLILDAMIHQQISVGAKKRRGFGRGKLHSLEILRLDFCENQKQRDYVQQWLEFDWNSFKGNIELEQLNHTDVDLNRFPAAKKTCRLKVPLKLAYSLMIRNYRGLSPDRDADYAHLCSKENPVIPGTSWAGAFRHRMYRIVFHLFRSKGLEPAICDKYAQNILTDLFGEVVEKEKKAKASRIWFSESVIENGQMIEQSRIKVDRFTGGVVNGALFQEIPVYGGTTDLEIMIEARTEEELQEDLGLLVLALKDLMAGYLAVGGETNIGKGIFSGDKILVYMQEKESLLDEAMEQQYFRALSRKIHRMANGIQS